jgi:hypothetical protein
MRRMGLVGGALLPLKEEIEMATICGFTSSMV